MAMIVFLSLFLTLAACTRCYDHSDSICNANHVFNAIHSSMRQWGSSWNYNGMSLFIASVPAHTEFYHGTFKPTAVSGMEWLAFEPEHAIFYVTSRWKEDKGSDVTSDSKLQVPLRAPEKADDHSSDKKWLPGYIHTYRTKHALSLLYLDGTSAAETDRGTLDTQDYLLLNSSRDHLGVHDETERAKKLCALAKTKWQSKIDGIIRMELGFEIILCNFEQHLDLVEVIQAHERNGVRAEKWDFDHNLFNWYRGAATRFDDIGLGRVRLNYDDFVTAYTFNLALFQEKVDTGAELLPRLNHLSVSDLDVIRADVDAMILRNHEGSADTDITTNWQAVVDAIVARYSTPLLYFTRLAATAVTRNTHNLTGLQDQIEVLMQPFINYAARNTSAEISRCERHFIPSAATIAATHNFLTTAHLAVTVVSNRICTDLFSILTLPSFPSYHDTATLSPFSDVQETLQSLLGYLDWSAWRRCSRECPYDEICLIPIWPVGRVLDRKRGYGECVNLPKMLSSPSGGEGDDASYWFPRDEY